MALTAEDLLTARAYLICPRNDIEASCGKACLITDTQIAQLLDVLKVAQAATEIGQEAVNDLWQKFLDLWCQTEEGA